MDEYFAELLGAFTGDGWMSKGSGGISLFITGNPKNEKDYYCKRIKYLFKKTFGICVSPREFPYWATYGICIGKRGVMTRFISAGMNVGRKASTVQVPSQIISCPKYYAHFVRGLFDTDGCISFKKSYNKNASRWQKQNKHRPIITIKTVSKDLAFQVQEMLSLLGIDFALSKKPPFNGKHCSFELRIESKTAARRFFSIIKPKNSKHLNKFKAWLSQGFY